MVFAAANFIEDGFQIKGNITNKKVILRLPKVLESFDPGVLE
jgi:hypothetical protein